MWIGRERDAESQRGELRRVRGSSLSCRLSEGPSPAWEPAGTNLKWSKRTGAVRCKRVKESCNPAARQSRRRCGKARHLGWLRREISIAQVCRRDRVCLLSKREIMKRTWVNGRAADFAMNGVYVNGKLLSKK